MGYGYGSFKGGLSAINYRCNYMQVFFKNISNVKTCMYTINELLQITLLQRPPNIKWVFTDTVALTVNETVLEPKLFMMIENHNN